MPVLIKDINDVQNMRTTYGSKLYSDNIPKNSDIIVQTIEKNGGLIIGKTNTTTSGSEESEIELKDNDKPACVAEQVFLIYE